MMFQKIGRKLQVVMLIALAGAALFAADRLTTRFYLSEGKSRAENTLRLTLNVLNGHLRRFEALPGLLGKHPDIRRLVTAPQDLGHRTAMNAWLKEANATLQSSDLYVMTTAGDTIAASNFDRADSFIGQNFIYRPYFIDAVAGGSGRYFALGTTSGVRGYYFAAPILDDLGRVAGVIACKVGLDEIEAAWKTGEHSIIVSDPEGIVFMSSDPGWLYSALLPLTAERQSRLTRSRRYAGEMLKPLQREVAGEQGFVLVTQVAADGLRHEYIEQTQVMADAGWTVHVLADTAYLRGQARLAMATFLLLICAVGFASVLVLQRRARMAERLAMQQGAQAELERRVDERTADLARVNRQIEQEIAERRVTEQELRRTQSDLVQAGKLAALGQMSAALSHELNQPLAAARNYADSAAILIARGDALRAGQNVQHIVSLIDRMAAIGKHLRNVARKPDDPLQDVDVLSVIEDAIEIAGPRLAAAGAEVDTALPAGMAPVRASAVRLQQVIVNVLSNAADAMEGGGDRRISITAGIDGGQLHLHIRDRGPGVPAAIAARIYDPFFTTKQVGSGLGLGLSISYNIMKDFGGGLRVANDPGGGAVFTLVLQQAAQARTAAE